MMNVWEWKYPYDKMNVDLVQPAVCPVYPGLPGIIASPGFRERYGIDVLPSTGDVFVFGGQSHYCDYRRKFSVFTKLFD